MTMRQLEEALKQLGDWLEWERETINDFHAFGQRFGFQPGSNVFEGVLREALAHRGLTLEQFHASVNSLSAHEGKARPVETEEGSGKTNG